MVSKFSHILMKWNHKDAIFAKRSRIFLLSGQIFRPFGKLLKRVSNTVQKESAVSSIRRKGKGQARGAALNEEG
jgi:hypothetical protein